MNSRIPSLFRATAAALSAAASLLAAPILSESFDGPLDPAVWKLDEAVVGEGRLLLASGGDESAFVDASIETQPAVAGLNFFRAPVVITLSDITLEGAAPAEKRAFIVHLGGDRAHANQSGYVRLCINGSGSVVLSAPGVKVDGRNTDFTLAHRQVTLPLKKIVLTLDRQGYRLDIVDALPTDLVGSQWAQGEWTQTDWTGWENAAPHLLLKSVRRPSPGSCEVALGEFRLETK